VKNFEIVKIGKLKKNKIQTFYNYLHNLLKALFSSSPMSQDGQICMCGACDTLYYNLLFVILKNLKKKGVTMERSKFLMPCVKLLGLETKNFSLIIVHTLYPSCLIFIHCNFMWHEYFHFCLSFDKHFFLPFTMTCNFFFNYFQLTCKTKKKKPYQNACDEQWKT
jgi:hypothetical protein